MDIALHLMSGVTLAAAAGARAFLPLLLVGLMASLGHLELGADFQWLSSPASLILFALASLAEIALDKFTLIDHLMDSMLLPIRALAGLVALAAIQVAMDPFLALAIGLALGGPVAAGVHLAKSLARIATTVVTFGIANPVVSLVEDALAVLAVLAAVFLPWPAFLAGVLVLAYTLRLLLRLRSSWRQMGRDRWARLKG